MSRKQRVLTGLREIEGGLLKAAKKGSKKTVANLMQNLAVTRDICREGLSENSYAKYGEIYDGLILTVEQMTKVKELRSNEEAFSLAGELLQYIIRETEQETNFKKDIFFLPYKASMWDSLESIWKAAYEDNENCNAYVVPIPYADLNPDRSVAEWHCERNQFPKYVPTLYRNEIDLKEWHPDVIFIHNPYDDFNRVTSVEHRYYSRHLKECTDKLVYVPYFVLGETDPEAEEAIENIKHFILSPGVINSDLVVVQSEKMRKIYINVLSKDTTITDRGYWEKRILGLGSPKFDKVAKSKKEDFKLPKEWEKLINGRKCILYNTGLRAMLEHRGRFVEKVRSVLEMFKAHDDVVLWWRPHPLLRATFQSMCPELLEEYERIVESYRREGFGIYDDTAELDRAIACTDVYYGDPSSVVQLYKATRKKVLYEVVSSNEYRWKLSSPHGLIVGDNFYFTPMNYNGLFVFHMHEARLEHLAWFGGSVNRFWCCGGICNLGDKMFIVPANDTEARIMSFSGKEYERIPISREYVDGRIDENGTVQFYGAYLTDDKVWMIPHHGRAIASLDLNSKKIEYYPEIYGLLDNVQENKFPIYGNSVQARGSLWIIYAQGFQILQFDLKSQRTYSYKVDESDGRIAYIDYDGKCFWLYTIKGILICWTPEDGKKKRIVNPLGLNHDYGGIKIIGDKVWLVASYQDVYGSFDIKTDKLEVYRDRLNYIGGVIGAAVLQAHDNALYVLPHHGNLFVRIQTDTKKVSSWKIEFSQKIKDKYQREYAKSFESGEWEWDDEAVFYVMEAQKVLPTTGNAKCAGSIIYKSITHMLM